VKEAIPMPNCKNLCNLLIIIENSEQLAVLWNKMVEGFFTKVLNLFFKSVKNISQQSQLDPAFALL